MTPGIVSLKTLSALPIVMEPAGSNDASIHPPTSLVARTVEVDTVSLRAFFAAGTPIVEHDEDEGDSDQSVPRTVWRTPDDETIGALGTTAICTASGPERFGAIRDQGSNLFGKLDTTGATGAARPRLFGGFSFLPAAHEEPWAGAVDARFVLPRAQYVITDKGAWLTLVGDPAAIEERLAEWVDRLASATTPDREHSPSIEHVERTTPPDAWREQVETVLSRIEAGGLRKVALAQSLSVTLDSPVSVTETLSRLAESYPECFVFSVTPGASGAEFFGATPERLVTRSGRAVETGALAGSIERGETDASDAAFASALADSEKDGHEHALVVDTIREQLDPVSRSVTVGERTIRKLATVQHLFTPISADLAGDEHVLSIVEALHPTPAVGGLPPDIAAETIREIEPFDRGWYAAPVGWFDASGDGTFAVAIRSAVATDDRATLFAGNGIVAGSDPEAEWDEVQLKYRPVLDALGL
jgi:menaquinone-specific isochorismate synthase